MNWSDQRWCWIANAVLCIVGTCSSWSYADDPTSNEIADVFSTTPEEFEAAQASNKREAQREKTQATHQESFEEVADYRITLRSGLVMDVGKVFKPLLAEYNDTIRHSAKLPSRTVIRLFNEETKNPMLVAQRRGRVLDGTLASFSAEGAPVAFASYKRGTRQSSMLTWDEAKRPYVFAQYADGKLNGVRCLFRGCCESCKDGHVWLVEEWEKGKLRSAHLSREDGSVTSFALAGDRVYPADDEELQLANETIAKFEKRLSEDESNLKTFVARYYDREKQAESQRVKIAQARMRYQMASAFQSAGIPRTSGGGFG